MPSLDEVITVTNTSLVRLGNRSLATSQPIHENLTKIQSLFYITEHLHVGFAQNVVNFCSGRSICGLAENGEKESLKDWITEGPPF